MSLTKPGWTRSTSNIESGVSMTPDNLAHSTSKSITIQASSTTTIKHMPLDYFSTPSTSKSTSCSASSALGKKLKAKTTKKT